MTVGVCNQAWSSIQQSESLRFHCGLRNFSGRSRKTRESHDWNLKTSFDSDGECAAAGMSLYDSCHFMDTDEVDWCWSLITNSIIAFGSKHDASPRLEGYYMHLCPQRDLRQQVCVIVTMQFPNFESWKSIFLYKMMRILIFIQKNPSSESSTHYISVLRETCSQYSL